MANSTKFERVGVDRLIPYINNAKQHTDDQVTRIASSIREFGFLNPVLIDAEYNVLAGHGRILAARKLGMADVPCVFVEGLTDAQRKAYILADNRLAELAEWDEELLMGELEELNELGFDVDLTGFEFDIEPDAEVVEDDVPEPPTEPKAKLGDLYQLGRHRLICGDSTDINVISQLMDGIQADVAITSPPYGASNSAKIRDHYVKGAEKPTSFYNDHDDDIDEWGDLIRESYAAMVANSKSQYINIQMLADNKRELMRFISDNAGELIDVIVWDKKKAPPQMQRNVLNNQFEFIFVMGGQSRAIPFADFHGNINNVISVSVGVNEYADVHRAVFPVALPAEILKIASNASTVLDVFGGTGTTLIACEELNRTCYMCELDPKYIDVIIERWENLTGEKAVLLNG